MKASNASTVHAKHTCRVAARAAFEHYAAACHPGVQHDEGARCGKHARVCMCSTSNHEMDDAFCHAVFYLKSSHQAYND
eukprot:scaffold30177_cov22-Tisochrysis_lutea.AAC.2